MGTMATTRQAIGALVRAHPGRYSKSELARMFGVSKERVRQIVLKDGLEPYLRPRGSPGRPRPRCARCGKPVSKGARLCADCYAELRWRGTVTLRCHWCGRDFALPLSRYEAKLRAGQRRFFCSQECRLAWWAQTLKEAHRKAFRT